MEEPVVVWLWLCLGGGRGGIPRGREVCECRLVGKGGWECSVRGAYRKAVPLWWTC